MAIETDTITLPVYWASALINGDYSGFDYDGTQEEADRCEEVERKLAENGWHICDIVEDEDGNPQEARFTWNYRTYDPGATCKGGEVVDYVIYRKVRS